MWSTCQAAIAFLFCLESLFSGFAAGFDCRDFFFII